ncbi:hypothetical protein P154DRAFT_577795 [Amniculicola lignicola CBS 123094]|uniref:Uncharacterized protein n=1 Tax=Amniculicola lignicola CBS 123094 TaxID=1392246 RepID=A0A6A5WC34_9PLEO|nr:hypothetical protein P154DRAFT_577795 [Amniculicola lignicola CBS 123094]
MCSFSLKGPAPPNVLSNTSSSMPLIYTGETTLIFYQSTATQQSYSPNYNWNPGLDTTPLFYNSLAQEVASHGFTVIKLDHPYDADVLAFPNGDVIYGGRVEKPVNGNTSSVEVALKVRTHDISSVLDYMKTQKTKNVVMFG